GTFRRRSRARPHPATFPPSLPEQCLRLPALKRVRRVRDPFSGLGSPAGACARLGVPEFIGSDIDDAYLQVAAERVRDAVKPRMAKAGLRAASKMANG